jgi:hypothetical protein
VALTLPNYRGTEVRQQNGPFIHASGLKENVPSFRDVEEKAETLVVLKRPNKLLLYGSEFVSADGSYNEPIHKLATS